MKICRISGKGPGLVKPAKPKTEAKDPLASARRVRFKAAAGKTKTVASNPSADSPSFPGLLTGDAIRAWRLSLGDTQAAFAARFKVSGATVSVWEKKGKAEVGMFPVRLSCCARRG